MWEGNSQRTQINHEDDLKRNMRELRIGDYVRVTQSWKGISIPVWWGFVEEIADNLVHVRDRKSNYLRWIYLTEAKVTVKPKKQRVKERRTRK